MVALRRRKTKRRVAAEQQGGDIQISSSGATIRLTWTTAGVLLVVVLAVIGTIKYYSDRSEQKVISRQITVGTVQADSVAARPSDNKAPGVISATIAPSNPTTATALELSYDVIDPESDPVTCQFRWFVDGALVQDGPANILQPGSYRKGSIVYAEVIPADQYSIGSTLTTPPVAILDASPQISTVTLAPETAYRGTLITATLSGAGPDGNTMDYQYQWNVNGQPLGEPSGQNSLDTSALNKRDVISVVVALSAGQISSGNVILKNRKPEITSIPPTDLQGGAYLYAVTARDADGDTLRYRLEKYPAGMTVDPSTGLIRWELPKGVMFSGRNEVKVAVAVDDGDGGVDSQEYTIILTDTLVY